MSAKMQAIFTSPAGKFRENTSMMALPLSVKSFTLYHSSVILPLDALYGVATDSVLKYATIGGSLLHNAGLP
jgi:hypothetical protein